MDIYLLQYASAILITAVIVLLIFNKLKLPTMIGLFITGIVIGHAINDTSIISTLSELGVVFLLFIIGLEFSIEKFSAIKRYALIGGALQVFLTTIAITLLGLFLGLNLRSAIFFGFLVAFSSTAIVMKIMQQKHMTHSIQGRVTLGILIFQDIAVIGVILLTPILGGETIELHLIPTVILKFVGLGILILIGAKWFIPLALRDAAKTKNRDLFMLLTLFICMGTTFATSLIGIGPELGAFIAGLLISNTEYSHQTLGYIQPFQDVFMSLFFISIGLMVNLHLFLYNITSILILTALILLINFAVTFFVGMILKLPTKVSVTIAILLSQIGEFSFVLASEGMKFGLMTKQFFSIFLGVSILTMSLTPFLQKLTPKIIKQFGKISYFQVDEELKSIPEELEEARPIEDHVILVGMGRIGKQMTRACRQFNVPILAVDQNPVVVEQQQALGVPIIYGNASNESVLKELRITSAQCIVISASTYEGTLKTIDTARRLNPDIHIIVRTKYLKNIEEVIEAGADEVIPKEFETSILMFTRIMDYYNKDMDEIAEAVNDLRSDNYNAFRSVSSEDVSAYLSNSFTDIELDSLRVYNDAHISDFPFEKYELTITSVIRENNTITNISDNFQFLEDDIILFTGQRDDINKFFEAI
ncbi:cation:proton antiporter [Methanobrevibacter millerae]|uniref:Monovalent cation:H+ antiporter-2, CPA2 family n=1 Tax=Methanobrevibacter millerae TaxID=230361 RepID=A0A1G5UU06_9EURY|nr:cation:proton antiporter [Methanobrevibacter millerae]SDA37100.1 monovalent cation:H+ antiporter-2, CPA2 family [Methanobrevibacter millerae]